MTPLYNPVAGAGGGLLVRRAAACAEAAFPAPEPAIVTSGAFVWVFGLWVDLGTPAQDLVLNYIHIANDSQAAALVDSTVELAYGPSWTLLDAARELAPFYLPGATTVWALPLSQMCQPVRSPAGQTIKVHAATASATPYNFEVMVLGWLGGLPAFDAIALAAIAGPGRWYPANTGAGSLVTTTGTYPLYGNPAVVVNPAPNDMLVVGLESYPTTVYLLDPGTLWQIGYGPAGSETYCATTLAGHTWNERWIWPPVLVRAGERLVVRSSDTGAFGRVCRVKVYDL